MATASQFGTIYDQPPPFSFAILLTLLVLLGASLGIFWLLVRHCTSHRQWMTLKEWARDRGFKFRLINPSALPPPIAAMSPLVRLSLTSRTATLAQLQTGPAQWNLLIRKMPGEWIPSGLRPAQHTTSLLDELKLSPYPAYSSTERFHLVSADAAAARRLSKSIARALIPPDVGLLLWGNWLMLDFTHRPFDPVEFGRMIELAEQVAGMLP